MKTRNELRARIEDVIHPNGIGAITAQAHQELLLELVDILGAEIDEVEAITDVVSDGNYPAMTVGYSDNLVGRGESTPEMFSFRASGGRSINDGAARIKTLRGNAVVLNQLINNILSGTTYQKAWYPRRGVNYASVQNGEIELRFDSQSDAFGNSLRQQIDVRPGDKIYISYDYESHNVDEFGRRVFMAFTAGWSSKAVLSDNCLAKGGEVVGHAEGFSIVPSDNSINALCIYFCYTNIASPDTTPLKIANFRFVNLTRMFGAGNEPTTIEEYHSRIPQGIDMDAYNEGEVIPFNGVAIKSVGDNAWDEEWRNGYYYGDGLFAAASTQVANVNPFKVIPNAEYRMNKYPAFVWFYDKDMQYISNEYVGSAMYFRTPSNAQFVNFSMDPAYGTTYNNDICISLAHSGYKEGLYFPYTYNIRNIDTRILEMFPDGMNKWDKVYNKNGRGHVVKGTGKVDMGSLMWQLNNDGRFETFISSARPSVSVTEVGGVLCRKYAAVSALDTYDGINGISIDNVSKIWVRDSAYTDVASFKAAMQGVMLYYELAEPQVYEFAEPFNLDYEVWDFGTEEVIASKPSAPISADIIYQFNAVDSIRDLLARVTELEARI